MMKLNADINNIYAYIGTVKGLTQGWDSAEYQDDYVDGLIGEISEAFVTDTIAANQAGMANIGHVFEWPAMKSNGVAGNTPSNVPLFKLVPAGVKKNKTLGFIFLPSKKKVPLPDPDVYGFNRSKLKMLSRHVFEQKALVMETMSRVTISPTKSHGRLFIPTTENKQGYTFYKGSTTINPGGSATGQFAKWWNAWFESRANVIATETAEKEELFNKKTGQRLIVSKTTRRFQNQGKAAFMIMKAAQTDAYEDVIKTGKARRNGL